jgi:L-2-hydroxyglutarate oxidase LhgO
MESVDTVVMGAGVVGLAVARALSRAGQTTLVLEQAGAIGQGTSSRNSEVLHAGLYYPTGTLKARLCVAGRRALVAYCEERHVPHRLCGKLLVANTDAQRGALMKLASQGRANGVEGLQWLEGPQARAMEPELAAVAALWSPATGVVDSHALMLALQGDLEAAGGQVVLHTPVTALRRPAAGAGLVLEAGGMHLHAQTVVNAAGLWAPALAARIEGLPGHARPRSHFAKGQYFSLSGRAPFSRLIYPMPEPGGLGVHLTLDLGGQARFGPDVQWLESSDADALDYAVDPARQGDFEQAIRRYWPGLPANALQPAYSGVRPKLSGPDAPFEDFRIDGPAVHGVPGLVQLFGIESPGLTACLALADEVLARLPS